jgi:hypothetical protein
LNFHPGQPCTNEDPRQERSWPTDSGPTFADCVKRAEFAGGIILSGKTGRNVNPRYPFFDRAAADAAGFCFARQAALDDLSSF